MKINKTGNNYSEILNKVAQTDWGYKSDYKDPAHASVAEKLNLAIEQMKAYRYDKALKLIDEARILLDRANIPDPEYPEHPSDSTNFLQ